VDKGDFWETLELNDQETSGVSCTSSLWHDIKVRRIGEAVKRLSVATQQAGREPSARCRSHGHEAPIALLRCRCHIPNGPPRVATCQEAPHAGGF
jgi:hypothetical protein